MKKVLLSSMLLLSVVSFGGNVYAQDAATGTEGTETPATAQAKVTFTPSADGKTLIISGQGDLTTYKTVEKSACVFTDKAVNHVFTAANANSSVAENGAYNADATYYQPAFSYTQLFDGGMPSGTTYVYDVKINQSWKEDKLDGTLYAGYLSWDKKSFTLDTKINSATLGVDKMTQTITVGDNEYSVFVVVPNADENYLYKTYSLYEDGDNYYKTEGVKFLTLSEVNSFAKNTTTYVCGFNHSIFLAKSEDGEKTQLTAGQTYTYNEGDLFYVGEASYVEIADNAAFFEAKSDYIKADLKELSVKDLLNRKILEGVKVYEGKKEWNDVASSYETVKFVNEGTEPLYIDNDIVSAILYPTYDNWGGANVTTTNLDLGSATLTNLTSASFLPETAEYRAGFLRLTHITLPLTNKTSVLNEDSKVNQYEDKMVVPSNILENFKNSATLVDVTIPEGYERIGAQAFTDLKVVDFHFPTTLKLIGNKAFYNCNYIKSLELNEGLVSIGEEAFCFGEASELRAVKFPSTLKIIKDGAFVNDKIYNLKFNAGLEFIGNGAFALPAEQIEDVLEIPASVKYIGPAAFDFRQYQDVYFYGEKAPLMPLGDSKYSNQSKNVTAFYSKSLYGYGGFEASPDANGLRDDAKNEGYANRENYKNGNTYFCILHYPKGLSDDNRAAYSDITRIYKTVEEGKNFCYGKTASNPDTYYTAGEESEQLKWSTLQEPASKILDFGFQDTYLGRQYIWPSQEAWIRSYIVNSNGYNWNGVDKYRPELTDDEIATLRYAGYYLADETNVEKGEYTLDDLKKIAHLGTRQFVLANADVNEDTEPEKEPEYNIVMKPGQWWTLCVPFNMTRKQVLETFGADTQLCLFYQVERHTTNGQNSILLKFTKDALNNSSTDGEGLKMKGEDGRWDYDGFEPIKNDDEVVVWAHESYMIKPMNGQDSDKDAVIVVKNFSPVVGNPLPTVVNATGTDQLQDDDYSKEYRFVGNYLGGTVIPKYSYIYASTNSDPTYKFRFYTGTKATWSPNKSIVQSHDRQGGLLDYKNFFGSDKSSMPQSAKQMSIFGADNFSEVTGIDNVTIIAGSDVLTPIFTLDGKMVSANGSVDGLAKGIYVKAGKKFVVK